jgi:hypothetical protein
MYYVLNLITVHSSLKYGLAYAGVSSVMQSGSYMYSNSSAHSVTAAKFDKCLRLTSVVIARKLIIGLIIRDVSWNIVRKSCYSWTRHLYRDSNPGHCGFLIFATVISAPKQFCSWFLSSVLSSLRATETIFAVKWTQDSFSGLRSLFLWSLLKSTFDLAPSFILNFRGTWTSLTRNRTNDVFIGVLILCCSLHGPEEYACHVSCRLVCPFSTYKRTYIHTHTHTYVRTYIHTYLHVHTYMRTSIHTYVRTYIRTKVHIYMHAYIHTYMQTHTHTHTHTYMRAWGRLGRVR